MPSLPAPKIPPGAAPWEIRSAGAAEIKLCQANNSQLFGNTFEKDEAAQPSEEF